MNETTLQVGVKVLLKNSDGKYLLLRRSLDKYPEVEGGWDIVGGRINPGKPLLENLKREIKEETALELIDEPKLIAAQDILRSANKHVVRLTYFGRAKEGEIKLDTSESDAYQWCSWQDLCEMNDLDFYVKDLLEREILTS